MPLGECNVLCKKSPLYMFNTFVRADASDAAITYMCPCCTQYFTRCIVCFVAAGRVGLPNTFLLPSSDEPEPSWLKPELEQKNFQLSSARDLFSQLRNQKCRLKDQQNTSNYVKRKLT